MAMPLASKRLIILIFLFFTPPVWALVWELSPFWGPYIGDTVSTSHISGLKAGLRWTESLSTAIDFGYSPLEIDPQSAYGSTVTSRRYYHLNGSLTGSLPASLKVREGKRVDMDLYGTIGGGWLSINRTSLGNGFFGVGSLFYLSSWVALRAEARTYLYKLPIPQGGFSVDAAFLVGPTFMFGGSHHRRPQTPF